MAKRLVMPAPIARVANIAVMEAPVVFAEGGVHLDLL